MNLYLKYYLEEIHIFNKSDFTLFSNYGILLNIKIKPLFFFVWIVWPGL